MKPEDSLQLAATAVEPVEVVRGSGFWHGMLAGFAAAGILAQLWFALDGGAYRRVYHDMGATLAMPFVLSPWWFWGAPVAQALGLAVLVVLRPRRVWWYLAAPALVVGCVALTWWLTIQPMRELGGQIQG
jgi:hypothetical protein